MKVQKNKKNISTIFIIASSELLIESQVAFVE